MDSLSYTSISRIRALVCPVGKIKRSRFQSFVSRLSKQNIVRLGDVSPLPRPDRTTFSPQGFPSGEIIYEFTATTDREHEYLEPYQLYRRCFLIIGIADHTENVPAETLIQQLEELKQRHRKALHAVTLVFDTPRDAKLPEDLADYNPDGNGKVFMPVPPIEDERITDMKTVLCDVTASLLSEFAGFAKTLMSYSSVDSPMAALANQEEKLGNRLSLPPAGFNSASLNTAATAGDKRMSIQGFGSGSLTERARNKGKARIQINIAELFLLAGRFPDALREFVDGGATARSNNDHLWHAKALEGIGVCILLLTRLKIDFQMPAIPFPTTETAAKSKSSEKLKTGQLDDTASRSSQDLLELLPDLFNTTLNLYSRSSNFPGESAPFVCMAEAILRTSRLLVAAYLNNGLDASTLDHIVIGKPLPSTKPPIQKGAKIPSRMDIATTVMKAYPGPLEALSVLESTRIYAGIASVLGCIGFRRRKALVTRELIRSLIPGLIQARIAGAAEAGVHPAAGLTAMALPSAGGVDLMEQESELGIVELLEDLCSSFGVIPVRSSGSQGDDKPTPSDLVMAENDIRSFGWTSLKIQILKNCIHLCEALPDLRGAMKFTTQLLKTAGVDLIREEQLRLSANIARTMGAARKLGLSDVEGEYWDAFLLRDIEVAESNIYKTPVPHTEEELGISSKSRPESNPFIYNPFTQGDKKPAEIFVVEGETVGFKITLQNPFEFEIEVESLVLDSSGVELDAKPISAIIPAFRTCEVQAFASPKEAGKLEIRGCRIKVFGCKERSFPIFTEGFGQSHFESKAKAIGLDALDRKTKRPVSQVSNASKRQSKRASTVLDRPQPKILTLTVVPPQPLVFAKSTSLSQSAIMVLEGEKKIFSIKLHNASSVPVDLVLFSFEDSTTAQLKSALSNKDISPSEIYEYETFLLKRRALVWHRTPEERAAQEDLIAIAPNSTSSFQVQVLGKPGLTNATVQVDYGYKASRDANRYFTRQVVLPLTVTVNASVELVRVDFLPLSPSIPPDHGGPFSNLFKKISREGDPSQYCLMLLDLRNAWPRPLKVKLSVKEEEEEEIPFSTESLLAPGHTNRILLPLKRIFLTKPHAAIPSISTKQRQFVVSATRITAEQERLQREAFWFREKVLNAVHAEWEEIDTGRKGDVELRTIRLGGRGIETLRVDNIKVEVEVVGEKAKRVHKGCYRISTNDFHKLRVTLQNRTEVASNLLLRVMPTLKNQNLAVALDLNRRLLFNGVLQRGVGLLGPGEEKKIEVGFVGLCAGDYEVSVIADEFKVDGEWSDGGRKAGKASMDIFVEN